MSAYVQLLTISWCSGAVSKRWTNAWNDRRCKRLRYHITFKHTIIIQLNFLSDDMKHLWQIENRMINKNNVSSHKVLIPNIGCNQV